MESYKGNKPKLFGILNITPDSFSDGGQFFTKEKALQRAKEIISEGACCIDIGGDSTRPGSECPGPVAEWERISEILRSLADISLVSVDTHHASVAKKAINNGSEIINDISCGYDQDMFPLIAKSGKKIILTYTYCCSPHDFSNPPDGDVMTRILRHFDKVLKIAAQKGIKEKQIILDPGMGAFLSDKPQDSWKLLSRVSELKKFSLPIMLSVSRKGFLKEACSGSPQDRDYVSAFISAFAAGNFGAKVDFHRTHNVRLFSALFEALGV